MMLSSTRLGAESPPRKGQIEAVADAKSFPSLPIGPPPSLGAERAYVAIPERGHLQVASVLLDPEGLVLNYIVVPTGVNARVDDLQRQNDKLVAEAENDQSQVKLTEAEAQNKKIQEQVGDLKLRISEMVSPANKSEAQNVELQNKLNDLQDELKKAQHQNDTLVPRHKKLRDGLTELQSQRKALQAQ
ncbi:hypothetical protein CSOJ01_14398 [Colletotrichum sojae]|uniref:Uncharacterized protein n=1 Tax=Colletotrichum sojae TaxID=2175907 RepID=A0A8H6IQY2_9PEZI|nr:hypothetical protein CSOJ01_14398 [Colletotrichum sojae]